MRASQARDTGSTPVARSTDLALRLVHRSSPRRTKVEAPPKRSEGWVPSLAPKTSSSLFIFIFKMSLVKIRRSCLLASQILHEVADGLAQGKAEKEVASEIRRLTREKADGIAFRPIVAFGSNSAVPHHRATARKLKKGDVVKIDLGVKIDGWCSDITRTFFTAKPTKLQREVYEAVLAAQTQGIRKVKVCMLTRDLDKVARDSLEKKGFAKNFIHSLGHGVGRKVHSAPKIGPKSKAILKIGSVIAIEPGVYLKGKFGVRIEDTLLVKKNGVELLTKLPKKITILKI
jgi:Xaa-Pro dipeptidase